MYVKVTNGEVEEFPYSLAKLRLDNPQVSFPGAIPESVLAEYGCFAVHTGQIPATNRLAFAIRQNDFPEYIDGRWVLNYRSEPLPPDQAELSTRAHRAALLQDSDWIVAKSYEAGEPVPTSWASYRQALRDITVQEGFPYSVTWPSKP